MSSDWIAEILTMAVWIHPASFVGTGTEEREGSAAMQGDPCHAEAHLESVCASLAQCIRPALVCKFLTDPHHSPRAGRFIARGQDLLAAHADGGVVGGLAVIEDGLAELFDFGAVNVHRRGLD